MKIQTTRFGEIETDADKIIQFPQGLPGFEDMRRFLLVPYDEESPFIFLQSADETDLAFLAVSPFQFFADYTFEIDDASLEELSLDKAEDLLVYALTTMRGGDIRKMTVNLLAPVVINQQNRQAKQIVLEKTDYTTRQLLFAQPDKGGE